MNNESCFVLVFFAKLCFTINGQTLLRIFHTIKYFEATRNTKKTRVE